MIVVNAGKFPQYFKYSLETASRSKLIDWFIFVSDLPQDIPDYTNIHIVPVRNLLDKIAVETFVAVDIDLVKFSEKFASFLSHFREDPSLLVQSVFRI